MNGAEDVVEVRRFRLDLPSPEVESLAGLLDVRERARLETLRSADHRRRFTVAHARARQVLGERLGLPTVRVRFRFGPHGKPGLDGDAETRRLRFSLTHSGELAVVALSLGREVGVDVERLDPSRDPVRFAARWFPPDESAWVAGVAAPDRLRGCLRLWTRKEACVKATGGRLVQGLALPVGTAPHPRTVDGPPGFPGPWTVMDLPAGPAHVGAVALEGTRPFRLLERSTG
ncbi:4'-phosphopantetheinyl transferase superfamily protein [Streptomyces sp. OUCMDZ-4982]|uniref:4'-phosphopantetheinyl transferase family protein n=1 Tax=Streptomyces sp. OUCMDZ-4982 TaxID=2973090 RepID=UPI00215BED4B|nr:4'-phosphopantetheinyl transferase superfamily protein [Streptomyces sp. OUCMDZ-4982]MCR8944447.1 4'-phosphopantetheinyl transferase superfamily protein [Streptomyces sp. OUCMDZ-4982]